MLVRAQTPAAQIGCPDNFEEGVETVVKCDVSGAEITSQCPGADAGSNIQFELISGGIGSSACSPFPSYPPPSSPATCSTTDQCTCEDPVGSATDYVYLIKFTAQQSDIGKQLQCKMACLNNNIQQGTPCTGMYSTEKYLKEIYFYVLHFKSELLVLFEISFFI